jgi:hypothetical protein
VDDDEVDDFAIGSPHAADPERGLSAVGAVYVYSGRTRQLLGGPLFGQGVGDRFGWSVAGGDLDGDGLSDLIVGAPYHDPKDRKNAGRVYIYTFRSGRWEHLKSHLGQEPGDRQGWAVACGQLAGSPALEAILAAPYSAKSAGTVYVLLGGTLKLLGKMRGECGLFGYSLAVLGRSDPTRPGDLLVGAPHNSENGKKAGRVYLISGRSIGAGVKILRSFKGARPGDQFGRVVAAIADIDGDLKPDFAIGAPFFDPSDREDAGRIYVYSSTGTLVWKKNGQGSKDHYGSSIAGGQYLKGSALLPALLVGAPRRGNDAGVAYLLSGEDGSSMGTLPGETPGDRFGSSVTFLGAIEPDGHPVILIGVPGYDAEGTDHGAVYSFSASGP